MRAYVGQTRSGKLLERLSEEGLGEMTMPDEYPPRRAPWALDNGAFKAWRSKTALDTNALEFALHRRAFAARTPPPDFVVVPDVVGNAPATLSLAREWIPRLSDIAGAAPLALVVQDGMTEADVEPLLALVGVLFVGGSTAWKWGTARTWATLARRSGRKLHIGRAGTPRLVAMAKGVGADSIDSSFPLWSTENLDAFLRELRRGEDHDQLGLPGVLTPPKDGAP